MSKRIRLTERNTRRAVEDNIPYPGTVNQPERKFKRRDQYDNYKETINHPTPDMRHEWKDNERDEIGFGIPNDTQPTVASVRLAAGKAVKVAVLLLGEKVAEELIEDQARDFMSMSGDAMDRTLSRFAETQELYASDDEDDDDEDGDSDPVEAAEEEKKEEKKEEKEAAEDEKKEDKEESKEAAEEEKKEDKKEVVEAKKATDDADEDEKSKEATDDADEDDDKKEAAEDEKKEDKEESKEAAEEVVEEEEVVEAKKSSTDMDIELTSTVDEISTDPEVDAQLASLFDGDIVAEEDEDDDEVEASKKAGIKKLGGQPKVASKSNMADIGSIWDSAPDVSGVFN